mmetsp:Transcript_60270/g.82824  ORF Transcript_60270/g.82824 Transcript_60270/m.82824 type:complete len:142 (+) Transcript_60270:188-613(+)
MDYVKSLKQLNKHFNDTEKNLYQNRENQILLNKLVDISGGKRMSNSIALPKKNNQTGPRSLNIAIRKKENDRIEKENHAIAKRLFEKPGSINRKRMDDSWNQHLKLKKQVCKLKKPLPGIKLPPIRPNMIANSEHYDSVDQ